MKVVQIQQETEKQIEDAPNREYFKEMKLTYLMLTRTVPGKPKHLKRYWKKGEYPTPSKITRKKIQPGLLIQVEV